MAKKIVLVEDPPIKTCVGCRTCELACSFYHEKTFNPEKSRIRIFRTEPAISYPVVCGQCPEAPCINACPAHAIACDTGSGTVLINEELCTGCGLCIEKCPHNAVFLHPDKRVAIKCDLCGGNPACIKFCPGRVLQLTEHLGV